MQTRARLGPTRRRTGPTTSRKTRPARERPRTANFNRTSYAWRKGIDYRKHPEEYRVGKGEQGVLIVEPYKSELLPFWRFKTPDIARRSAGELSKKFLAYLAEGDFVGADMARKFLQMGYTRSRRYANYAGGRKYRSDESTLPRGTGEELKAVSAQVFYERWREAEANPDYAAQKLRWKASRG